MSIFDAPFDPAREAALVTGAGNGIGRAIAQALVGEGVRTVFADVNRGHGDGGRQGLGRGRNWRCPGSAISPIPPRAMRCWRKRAPPSGG